MPDPLNSFDHVVVLMLENRSFDNILGNLYYPAGLQSPPAGSTPLPAGKTFEGIAGKTLTNPGVGGQSIPVSVGSDFHQPYPDPGEEFNHITFQLFQSAEASSLKPAMQGFVEDYWAVLTALESEQWCGSPAQQSAVIMKCFAPASTPVLSALATEFAVFDHWFCAVPSQTWCNRAFWHAATSWGWVNNPAAFDLGDPWNLDHWAASSAGRTLFDLLEPGNWCIYEDLIVPFTKMVHWGDLKDKSGEEYFRYLEGFQPSDRTFFRDCKNGDLPQYSFLEPHFINLLEGVPWHDDMHPSSFDSIIYSDCGPGSVTLGDQLVWKVYQAIRNSPKRSTTLLIITFDEHGGCYDHVPPPQPVTPPDPSGFNTGWWNQCVPGGGEDCFDFKRLGVRVPMVMVSDFIAKNTIVNSCMDHCSFLKTMAQKWGLPSLGPRQDAASPFTEVFAVSARTDPWPDFPIYPGPTAEVSADLISAIDPRKIRLNGLQASIIKAIVRLYLKDADLQVPATLKDAQAILDRVKRLPHPVR